MPLSPHLADLTSVLLVVLSFVTSALTASLGAGGGLLVLGAMAGLLPAGAVIPVHGIVQLGSNGGRAALVLAHVAWRRAAVLLGGAAIGAAIGALGLAQLPVAWLQLFIGAFILAVVWLPLPGGGSVGSPGTALFGAFAGLLSLFVGATGPLVGAFLQRQALGRQATVATMAACMTGLNVFKLLAFDAAGFVWAGWLLLAALMILSGLAGTWVGLRVLAGLSEARFRGVFRALLSALAVHALWQGTAALWG
jgi:uncharacterized membrane protein YfcA